ncbi:hypothetical protein HOY80DRAFT_892398 [Tuber brumale]|nr:hypothetical protein HOY80DRAFT_892398 [Tuber brumale]
MSFAAAFNFIFKPLIDFPSHITASINYAQRICTPEDSHSTDTTEDYFSGSENSTFDSDSDSEYHGNYRQTRHKHLAPSLATSPSPSATAKSLDRVGLAKDLESTGPARLTNSDTKPGSGSFGFPRQKPPFALPFVSGLQSKLLTVTGISAFGGPERSNTAEAQLLRESLLGSAEKPAFSDTTSSSALPYSVKPSYSSHSANAAVPASPRSQLGSTFCPKFRRSKPSAPRTRSSGHPSKTFPFIAEQRATSVAPVKGPFDNFVHLPPPFPSDPRYTTLSRSVPQQQSAPRAAFTPVLNIEMAEATPTGSPKPTATTPKNIPWNRVYEIHASQLHGHLRFLKLLAANKGHSQPLTQCISRAETLLKDATTAAAAFGISTAGPIPAKPEKRRRSVRFEDEVAKEAKPDKKNKTAHKLIQRPKMRHAKPSKAQIAALLSTLGKRVRDGPNDSDGSSAGGAVDGEKVIRKKIRKEYFTPGMVLEFESSDDEDDEEFVPPGEGEEEEEDSGDDSDSDESGDAEKGEQDPSPSPEVDRKRTKASGVDGKRTADKDINRKNVAKEGVKDTTAAKDVPESNKKRKIVVLNAMGQTVPSTQEGRETGRGKRIRPS